MVVCQDLEITQKFDASVLTIGSFDGLHMGHVSVIEQVLSISRDKSIPSIVISFNPHPKTVLKPKFETNNQIISPENKIKLLKSLDIDYLWLIPFDATFSRISAETFLSNYLVNYFNPVDIIIGYDHNFGKNQSGNAQFLLDKQREFGFLLHIVSPISINNQPISSTLIRNLLHKGDMKRANTMLGREYELTGTVVKGSQRGSSINFPTANILIDADKQLIPGIGVYCVDAYFDGKTIPGMCNIGKRPTYYEDGDLTIEVHLISDSSFELYGKKLTLYFKQFIRDEMKYSSDDELVTQLHIDRNICLSL